MAQTHFRRINCYLGVRRRGPEALSAILQLLQLLALAAEAPAAQPFRWVLPEQCPRAIRHVLIVLSEMLAAIKRVAQVIDFVRSRVAARGPEAIQVEIDAEKGGPVLWFTKQSLRKVRKCRSTTADCL